VRLRARGPHSTAVTPARVLPTRMRLSHCMYTSDDHGLVHLDRISDAYRVRNSEFVVCVDENCPPENMVTTRANCKGAYAGVTVYVVCFLRQSAYLASQVLLGSEDPPPEQAAEETVLTEAEVKT
jgi:hypothetical protein